MAKPELISGEDEAVMADLDPLDKDTYEKDDFTNMNDLASCMNSALPCVGDDDDKLSN